LNSLETNIDTLNDIKEKATYKRSFSFFNYPVAIATDSREIIRVFEVMYSKFFKDDQQDNGINCYIIKGQNNNSSVIINNELYPIADPDSLVFYSELLIFRVLYNYIDDYFILHAGVISRDGKGFIIMAPSSFGKTTLVMELVSRGYKFLSDEYCSIRVSDYYIDPFPRTLGVKESSPFYNAFDREKFFYHTSEKKISVGCENIYPGCIGEPCKPYYLIVLKSSFNNRPLQDKKIFALSLLNDDRELIDKICTNKSIKLLDKSLDDNFIFYRFSLASNCNATKVIQDFCAGHEDNILAQSVLLDDRPDFNSSPTIKAMSKFDASLEVLKNLLNRSQEGKLYKRFKKQNSLMLYTVVGLINNLDCYEMEPGVLKETADIVDSL
jgi:hypothetical protein